MVTPTRAWSGGTRLARAWTPGNLSRPADGTAEVWDPLDPVADSPHLPLLGQGLSVVALRQGNWPSGSGADFSYSR
jgi:hypothetical protein